MVGFWLRLFASIMLVALACVVSAQAFGNIRHGAMIAFASEQDTNAYNIFLLDVAWGTLAQVTKGDTTSSPAWSHDGQTLAWLQGGANATFWAMDMPLSTPYPLTPLLISAPHLAWSPTDSQFLFEKTASTGWKNIILMNALTGEWRNLTENNQHHETSPSWENGGQRFVFNFRDGVGHERVAIYDLATSTSTVISDEQSVYPSWSPNGAMIAYLATYRTQPKWTFYEVATGVDWSYFSAIPIDYVQARWSSDSQKVAFGLNSGEIKILEVTTGKIQDITPRNTYDISPSWSPDGRYLVLVENTNRRRETKLVIVDIQTGDRQQVTFSGRLGADRMPVWRP
jgi:Tol biopolymer transport system component